MKNHLLTIAILLIIVGSSSNHAYAEGISKEELKEKIINAWLENSAKIDSYRLKYELKTTVNKEIYNYWIRRQEIKEDPTLISKDINNQSTVNLLFHSGKFKFEKHGQYFRRFPTRKHYRIAKQRIIKPDLDYDLRFNESADEKFPWVIYRHKTIQSVNSESIFSAIIVCTAPFKREKYSETYFIDILNLNITTNVIHLNSNTPIKFTVPPADEVYSHLEIVVDPKQNYLPKSILKTVKKPENLPIITKKCVWTFSKYMKIQNSFIPEEFIYRTFKKDGMLRTTSHIKLVNSVINKTIPDSEFTPKPPKGSWVNDKRTNKHYVIQKNGFKRIFPTGITMPDTIKYNYKIYDVLMNPKYNHLNTVEEINQLLNDQ